jgi:copper resistance protein C
MMSRSYWSLLTNQSKFFSGLGLRQMQFPVAVLSWLLLMASVPAAHAHASLLQASPAAGSMLSAAPQEVALTFTDKLEAAFSKLTVADASGTEVSQGKAQISGNTMRISLKALGAGLYKVTWRAVSADTHKTEGSFMFSIGVH